MKRVIVGRLAMKPEVKEVTAKGKTFSVTDFAIYEADSTSKVKGEDGKEFWPEMVRNCRAYGDVASELATLEKGATVAAIATIKMQNWEKDGKMQRKEFYQFNKLGNAKELVEQSEKLFSAYIKGAIDKLDAGVDPSFPAVENEKEDAVEVAIEEDLNYEEENFMEP